MMQIETSKSFKSGNKKCMLCKTAYENDIQYGELKTLDDITVHYFCLLLASHIEQRGNDDEGILGFLPNDIRKIINRGKKFKCIYCKLMGATVHCIIKKCQNVFHLICGLEKGTLHQYFGQFKSYCHRHRPKQKVPPEYLKNEAKCLICLNSVYGFVNNDSLWPPCCKNTWFHRICVQKLALSTGYFFKCPLCNNLDIFVEAMKKQGIYIPSRDASWELEENAYSDLLFSYSHCDAITCYCPKGRTYSSNHNDNGSWDLLLCATCGSQGCHRKCSNMLVDNQWECLECKEITQYVKSTTKKKKKKRNYKKYKKVKLNDEYTESLSSSSPHSIFNENTPNNNLFEIENENKNKYEDKENNENHNISLSLPKISISIKDFLQSHSISQKLITIDCSDSDDDFDIFEILKSEISYLRLNFGSFEEQKLNFLEQYESENVICNKKLKNLSIQNNNEQKKTEQISSNNTFLCHPQNILHEMCESIITNEDNSFIPNKTTCQNDKKFIIKSKNIQHLKNNNEESEKISNSDFNKTSVDLNDEVEIIEIIKKPRIVEVIDLLDDKSNESVNKYDMNEIIEIADNDDFEKLEIFNVDEDLIEID